MKVNISNEIAKVDLANLPSSSVARLYNPETRSNSFALDGFPKINVGAIHELPLPISWHERLIEIIEDWGALDMTTNQTLLRQLVESGAMDERIRELAKNLGVNIDKLMRGEVKHTASNDMQLLELEGEIEILRHLETEIKELESVEICG